MKQTLILFTLLSLLLSCGKKAEAPQDNLEKLQTERLKIQQTVDSLYLQLKIVEKAIHDLDTLKKLQKVTVFTTKDTIFKHYIALQGIVVSDKNVVLKPEMSGTIKQIFVKEGQAVGKGQTLVQLDANSLYDKVTELKTQLVLATTTFERQERLWKQNIGSEMQYLGAKAKKEGLENSLKSLHTQIGKMKIKAPFSGVIDVILPKVGELIGSQIPVIRLINLNKVHIEAEVPETYLPVIKKGTEVLINFPAINKQLVSKINKIGNYINPDNRSFKVRIPISNRDHLIKPNLLADLKVNDFTATGIVLASDLIQMNQKAEQFVFVVKKDSLKTIVSKRILDLGKEYKHQVFITNGLQVNERVVLEGGKFVKDADEVDIFNSK